MKKSTSQYLTPKPRIWDNKSAFSKTATKNEKPKEALNKSNIA